VEGPSKLRVNGDGGGGDWGGGDGAYAFAAAGLVGWKAGTVPRLLGGQGAGDERRETTLKTGTR
jgi:hypothetical protein